MNRIYEEIKPGDKFGFMEVTGKVSYRVDKGLSRKRKYYEVWCNHCKSYQWIREDNLRTSKSCGCLSKSYRAKWLFLKGGMKR